jgi:hypothetical protein
MTKEEESIRWREIGDAFAEFAETGERERLTYCGLCHAAFLLHMPSYNSLDARIPENETHENANHRALTAYLLAEMILDDAAPTNKESEDAKVSNS